MVALHARDVLYSMPCTALSQIGAGSFAAEAAPRRTHVERALYASPKVGGGHFREKSALEAAFSALHAILGGGWPRWAAAPSFRAFRQRRNAPAILQGQIFRQKFRLAILQGQIFRFRPAILQGQIFHQNFALQFCRDKFFTKNFALQFCRDRNLASRHANFCRNTKERTKTCPLQRQPS